MDPATEALITAALMAGGKLVQIAIDAFANRNAKHEEIAARYRAALDEANAAFAALPGKLAENDAAVDKMLADAKAADAEVLK